MEISQIRKDKFHLSKIILSNGKEIFLDNDIVSLNSLFEGYLLEEATLTQLLHDSDYKRAKSRALFYLDRMDYSEKALFDKLVKAGFAEKICAEVLENLTSLKLIDDRRLAERMAERLLTANRSKREIINKMYLKGIPYDLAREVLNDTPVDEVAQITALIEKKYAFKLQDRENYNKVYAALIRKGFSYSAVKSALKTYIDELEFCEE